MVESTLASIVGAEHLLTDPDLRAGAEVDWTGRWRGTARAVVRPGALVRNDVRRFVCRDQLLRIEARTAWTAGYRAGQEVVIPIKNGEGGFVAGERTLDELEGEGRVVARYLGGNPNGSARDIAGIANAGGNVVGLMPHPEHAVDPLTGPSADGLGFFTSILTSLVSA